MEYLPGEASGLASQLSSSSSPTSSTSSSSLPSPNFPTSTSSASRCPDCWGNTFLEDARAGDLICSGCGLVMVGKLISEDAEYRNFADSSTDKTRVGASYNPLLPHSFNLGSKSKLDRDEKEFLWDGLKDIDDVLSRLYNGDRNVVVQTRAKELFHKAFDWQWEQKKNEMERQNQLDAYGGNGASEKERAISKHKKTRKKFSRRKQFVVACLWWALRESHIHMWDVPDLSNHLYRNTDRAVSSYSVKRCLKDLNLR